MGQVVENERRQQLIDLAWFGVGHEPQWLLLKRALEDDAVEIAAVSEVLNAVGGEIGDLVLIVIEMDATFRHTKASRQHKQDPVAVTQAWSELDSLEKGPGWGGPSS